MTVTLDIRSDDVQHSWWIPELGGKMDALPGYTNKTWFKVTEAGRLRGPVRRAVRAQPRQHATPRVIALPFDEWQALVRPAGAATSRTPRSTRRRSASSSRQQEGEDATQGTAGGTNTNRTNPSRNGPRRLRRPARRPARRSSRARSAPSRRAGRRGSRRPTTRGSGSSTSGPSRVFFVLGGVEALLIRLQLGAPENTLLSPERYNQLFTMHGTTMVFLVVVPVWAGLANYLLPLMIGARDVAFPRLNAWSYWMFLFGGIALYASFFWTPPEAGWFSYVPLSTEGVLAERRPGRVDLHGPPHRPLVDARRGQLHRHDPQHARARHGLGPPAAVRLDDPDLLVPDRPGASRRWPRR